MQYTTHYNLNLPEGTDIVNPLVQDNPNYTAIDTAMYANKLRVIGTATELASGTVHALTRSDTDINAFKFVATADYNTGDTFTVDGVSVTARRADGTSMKNKAYVINSTVFCILDGTILNFIGVDGVVNASDVEYDNTSSGLVSTNDQDAIDELSSKKLNTTQLFNPLNYKYCQVYGTTNQFVIDLAGTDNLFRAQIVCNTTSIIFRTSSDNGATWVTIWSK